MGGKLVGFIVGLFVMLLIGASLLPNAITSWEENETPTQNESFTTTEGSTTPEAFTLSRDDVVADSETVTYNLTPIAKPADYTMDNDLGVLTVESQGTGDAVAIEYENAFEDTTTTIYGVILILALIGILLVIWRRASGGKGGMD